MTINTIKAIVGSFVLAANTVACTGSYIDSPGTPPGGHYFAFVEKAKTDMLSNGNILLERVDNLDTTQLLGSQRLFKPTYVLLFNNAQYIHSFQLWNSVGKPNAFFVKGRNRLRLIYSGQVKRHDWLEFDNRAEEWLLPENVKFNGKPIQRTQSNEPVKGSYLYVLE